MDFPGLLQDIRGWSEELGFQELRVADTDLRRYSPHVERWLNAGFHGEMHYMAENRDKRYSPAKLHPGTFRVLCVRMDYAKEHGNSLAPLGDRELAYVSRYARGRDYHKLIRKRLQQLASRIEERVGEFGYRAFVDSAPVLERALAEKSGMGWIGKNTMLLNQEAGSWFFLGELFTDLPLPLDKPTAPRCGSCRACLDICPTHAFVGPNLLDATRCISYLTIELKGSIPEVLRKPMGNRVFGCDDCQLICPWNKFATPSSEDDFSPRHRLDKASLVELFSWSEEDFESRTQGSAIRRIGYAQWLRNIAVGLGNANTSLEVLQALQNRAAHPSELVREHVAWALAQHNQSPESLPPTA